MRQRASKNFGIFKDSVSNSGYALSNGRIVKEHRIKNYVLLVVAYFEVRYSLLRNFRIRIRIANHPGSVLLMLWLVS